MSDAIRDAILEITGDRISPDDVAALARHIAALIEEERRRCAKVCLERAELWRHTSLASAALPAAREEARARANEAQYLSDALLTQR
jgi:hypothetical protein